jgi:HTH-type transcriptional regulator/antitoxin HigA
MPPINLHDLTPAHLIHPGEILNDELKARKITQAEFAKTIGIERSQLNEYIKGKRDFTVELCLLTAAALEMSEEIWLNIKQNYEVNKVKIDKKIKAKLAEVEEYAFVESLPKKFLKQHNVLSSDTGKSIERVRKLYNVAHLSEIQNKLKEPRYAYHRKSEMAAVSITNLITWELLVRQQAKNVDVGNFDVHKAEPLAKALKQVFKENDKAVEKSRAVLSEFGIKLVHLPKPESCAVDGFSFWSGGTPAIGLSLRYNRIDHFAFTLMHELGHVFLHLPLNPQASFIDIEDENGSYGNTLEEKEANAFARNHLIDPKVWEAFKSKYFRVSDDLFTLFAEENGIHPAIAFGRYCYEMKDFKKRTKIVRSLG